MAELAKGIQPNGYWCSWWWWFQWCIFDDEDDEDEVDMTLGWKIWMHMLRTFSLQCFPVIISVISCVFGDLLVPLFHPTIKVMDVLLHSYQKDLKQSCEHNQPKSRTKSPKTALTNTWAFLKAMFLTDVSYSSSACFIFPEMEQDACLGWWLMFLWYGHGMRRRHTRRTATCLSESKHLSLKVSPLWWPTSWSASQLKSVFCYQDSCWLIVWEREHLEA